MMFVFGLGMMVKSVFGLSEHVTIQVSSFLCSDASRKALNDVYCVVVCVLF